MSASVLRAHLAVHYLTVAEERDGGLALNADAGRLLEVLAPRVRELTLLAYDPPPVPRSLEDRAPYVIAPPPPNLRLVSLGPKGDWRTYPARRRRVASIVRRQADRWDLLLLRLVNRRAQLVWRVRAWPRLVTQVGGSRLVLAREGNERLVRRASAWLEERWQERIIRNAALTFVVGEDLARRYRRLSDGVRVVPESGLRASDLYRCPDRCDEERLRLLVSGRITAAKGVFEALETLRLVRASYDPKAELHVVGDGPAKGALERAADAGGVREAVFFHGWIGGREQLLKTVREMDVLLCLSHVESMPRVVWEALGSSVLVVATPVGGLPYAFEGGAEVCFVRSAREAAAAIHMLLEHPEVRRGMLERGLRRASEATLEAMVDRMIDDIVTRWPELSRG